MSLHTPIRDPLFVPQIGEMINVERSEIIAAAYASDMTAAQFEALVIALYPEEDFQ